MYFAPSSSDFLQVSRRLTLQRMRSIVIRDAEYLRAPCPSIFLNSQKLFVKKKQQLLLNSSYIHYF